MISEIFCRQSLHSPHTPQESDLCMLYVCCTIQRAALSLFCPEWVTAMRSGEGKRRGVSELKYMAEAGEASLSIFAELGMCHMFCYIRQRHRAKSVIDFVPCAPFPDLE